MGIVALDTETNDEGLRADRGSAWPWRGGHVCGISVAWRADGEIRAHLHSDAPSRQRELRSRAGLSSWLRDHVASDVRIVTQNGLYDWGWLRTEAGIMMPPSERLEEIGALATIVDENLHSYSLNALCAWRGLPGKDETLLKEAVKARASRSARRTRYNRTFGNYRRILLDPTPRPTRSNTLALFENLNPILDQEGTRAAYRLDVDLLPMVHEMRRRGIRIDQSAAEQARDLLPAETRRRARRAVRAARHTHRHGRDRIAKMEGADLRRSRHRLSAHGEGQSIIHGRQNRLDGRASRTGCRN